jgi:Cof subfamily protein (haloacid dehalogenase superfamily)
VLRKAVSHKPIKPETARQVIDLARARYPDVLVSCEIMDRWFTDRHDPNITTETGRLFTPDIIAPIDEICVVPITKLLLLGDEARLLEIEPLLLERFAAQLAMVRTEGNLIQIMDRRVSKGLAVKQVAEHYGLTMDQVMSIGDAPNDVGMLHLSGIAVAMENGWDVVKNAAHWIAPSNNNDGVLAALRKFGLCE